MAAHDEALLDRWIRVRDAEAFRALVDRYSRIVFGTALRILRSSDRAEDVAQECFLKLAQVPEPRKHSLGAWLHRVSTNLALSSLRSDARRELAESMRPANHDPPPEVTWEELEPLIDEAIESLPPEQRIPIVEHFLHGRTHREIAREIGLTRKAIGYRLGAGIESIRGFLRSRGISDTAGVLLAGFAGLTAGAVPASLTASLGKIAVGGAPLPAPSASAAPAPIGKLRPNESHPRRYPPVCIIPNLVR